MVGQAPQTAMLYEAWRAAPLHAVSAIAASRSATGRAPKISPSRSPHACRRPRAAGRTPARSV
eukprot:6734405-Alexandrium_andersonii.AAC.1